MKKNLVLPSQRNELYKVIVNADINPAEFEWRERPSVHDPELTVSQLVHRPSDYYYVFDFYRESQWTEYSPGADASVKREYPGSWNLQFNYASNWIGYLKREIETPNLWGALADERALVDAAVQPDQDNSPFTADEKKYVSDSLREIKEYIVTTHSLSAAHTRLVEDRITYLLEASERVGRKDWINLTLATLINIILIVALPPDAARELLRFAGQVLHRILQGPFLLM